MKKLILASAFALALALPAGSQAAEPIVTTKQLGGGSFSGDVTLVNQYLFRGLKQSDDNPALQGSLGYSHPIGPVTLSGGVWGSNVDFQDSDQAQLELDYTFGLSGEIKGFSWGVGGIYYDYPGAASSLNYDYWEIYGTLGYDFKIFSAELGINYSPDNFGASGTATYTSGTFNVPVGKYLDLGVHLGYQTIENNTRFGTDDYFHYEISAGFNVAGIDFKAAWNDTDLNESQSDTGKFLISASKSF